MSKSIDSKSNEFKVLHITNWYPTEQNPNGAIWIDRHINALNLYSYNKVIHAEVVKGKYRFTSRREILGNQYYGINAPTSKWFIKEILSSCLLFWILVFKVDRMQYNVINIHIAYPLCTYLFLFLRFIKLPIIFSEHWSAYHLNFGVKSSKKLGRIKRIFNNGIPVITVSKALAKDLQNFVGDVVIKKYVVPNVVDTKNFVFESGPTKSSNFFMVSQWQRPKDPFTAIRAFARLFKDHPESSLRIGGYGDQVPQMLTLIKELNLIENVSFIGRLSPEQVAMEMRLATALVHISDYETFSVVCAEAICCGTPVIASKVGGVTEYLDDENSILLEQSDIDTISATMAKMMFNIEIYNREQISIKAISQFNERHVGRQYLEVLKKVRSEKHFKIQ